MRLRSIAFIALLSLGIVGCKQEKELPKIQVETPENLYGDLFYAVQTQEVFPDSKTFVDQIPQVSLSEIKTAFENWEDRSVEGLRKFVDIHFELPNPEVNFQSDSLAIETHIQKLWSFLKREQQTPKSGTLIALPNPYIVPGGRFREVYYWDSYFTMLGLQQDGEIETIQHIVDNFAYLIDTVGFVPNANRTYYKTRSQPPFFSLMVGILAEEKGFEIWSKYKEALVGEYNFWMEGIKRLNEDTLAYRRVVKMPDGSILNRYWDDADTPRAESYREDVATVAAALAENPQLNKNEMYRHLRAAAESGWDFSSRWIRPDEEGNFPLKNIHTTEIIPVDLNALLFHLEQRLTLVYHIEQNLEQKAFYFKRSQERLATVRKYLWSAEQQFFMDYDSSTQSHTPVVSVAGMYALAFYMGTVQQGAEAAKTFARELLKPGGVVSTPHITGQQWDAPNGWAPLQWMSIRGLKQYNQFELADQVSQRWMGQVRNVYQQELKLVEKYDVLQLDRPAGGGEYPNQDGFGWTNGVFQKLNAEYLSQAAKTQEKE
ncbi:MAG: alpha,alpha-trehalase TreF [Flavobacteriaceae bacterium]